jgi:hypothetical protein
VSDDTEPLPRVKQIPKEQIVKDLCEIIRWMPLTEEQIQAIYDIILMRKNEPKRYL